MNQLFEKFLLLCVLLPLGAGGQTQQDASGLVVTYVEASAAKSSAVAADLKAYAQQIETVPAKPKVVLLSELGRPQRMLVIEQWADLSSPAVAEAGTLLAAKVQADVQAPVDRRLNHPMTPADAPLSPSSLPASAFYVVMHVDIRGNVGDAPKVLQAQRNAIMQARGALGYEVTVQDERNNHFTIAEVWKDRASYEAYTSTGPAQDLRRQLAPLIGSPFDDRLYARVGK